MPFCVRRTNLSNGPKRGENPECRIRLDRIYCKESNDIRFQLISSRPGRPGIHSPSVDLKMVWNASWDSVTVNVMDKMIAYRVFGQAGIDNGPSGSSIARPYKMAPLCCQKLINV